jgi:exosortase
MNDKLGNPQVKQKIIATAALTLLCLVGVFWTALSQMASKWENDPQYSHGWFVPVLVVMILWSRKDMLDLNQIRTNWWGLLVLVLGLGLRQFGAFYFFNWFDHISIIPCVFGLIWFLGGTHTLKWGWPAAIFLFYMIPLPFSAHHAMQASLQRIGTASSTYLLQTIGLPAMAEGNMITINDERIEVAAACSGLSMLMVFFALSHTVALLSDRMWWEKVVILGSAVPIALVVNITRITVTGICYAWGYSEFAKDFFHDFAGFFMMPMALVLLWMEHWYLSHLFLEDRDDKVRMGLGASSG